MENKLLAALKQNMDDELLWLAVADSLEEQGNILLAETYRWCQKNRTLPAKLSEVDGGMGRCTWSRNFGKRSDIGHLLFQIVKKKSILNSWTDWADFGSLEEAMDALAQAIHSVYSTFFRR